MLGAVVLGFLFFVGIGAFTVHVYKHAVAEGVLPLPKVPKADRAPGAKRLPVREHAFRARARAARGGRTVSVVFAEAVATNWLARRKHKRQQEAAAAKALRAQAAKGTASAGAKQADPQPRRSLLNRLVNPSGNGIPAAAPPAVPAQPAGGPSAPAPGTNGRNPATVPVPAPTPGGLPVTNPPNVARDDSLAAHGRSPGGSPMTTPAAPGGAGASADFFSALHRIISEAWAGGIRHKARANLVMGEGFVQQAVALDQHARHLQESGRYPAYVWEPLIQAAAMQRASAAKCTESGNAIAEIARTPAGELAGRAPHRDELNRA